MDQALSQAQFTSSINFVLELAKHLHTSGTSVNRLEDALGRIADKLHLQVNIWSNPTGIMISINDQMLGEPHTITRVMRLQPGETNLARLANADAIAEKVMADELGIQEGLAQLKSFEAGTEHGFSVTHVVCYGIASAMVLSLFPRTGWADLLAAGVLGALIGVLVQFGEKSPRFYNAHEAIAAFTVTLLASFAAAFIAPLSLQSVIISALIILMPGLMLTLAVNELAEQHLTSGSARFAGALTVLMKLTFGTIIASELAHGFGWRYLSNADAPLLPIWVSWSMLLPGAYALAVLFKTSKKDIPIAMAAVLLGYGMMKLCALLPALSSGDMPLPAFLSALVVTGVSNSYARIFRKPGALIRVPGIILLVPGSLGFKTLNFAFAQDLSASLDLALSVIAALVALVAGILFGNLLVPSRRSL